MDDQPAAPLTLPARDRDYVEERPRPLTHPPQEPPPPQPPRSRLRSALSLLLVLLIIGVLVIWVLQRGGNQTAQPGRFQSSGPTPVGTAKVEKGDMPIALTALGTVTPLAMVTVKTQINGQLVEVAYQEGQMVKKGDF